MNSPEEWGSYARGDREDAARVWVKIDALLSDPACAGRPVQYQVEGQPPVSREHLAAWIVESASEGFRAITYSVDPLHDGPVEVTVWASHLLSAEEQSSAHT